MISMCNNTLAVQSSQAYDNCSGRIAHICVTQGKGCIVQDTCEHNAAAKMGPSWQSSNCKQNHSKPDWESYDLL